MIFAMTTTTTTVSVAVVVIPAAHPLVLTVSHDSPVC
jgi:hypothetical protein